MKPITYSLVFIMVFFTQLSFSQNINQFDDMGKRHGAWQKTYESSNVLRYEGNFSHGKEIGTFKFYKNESNKAVLAIQKDFKVASDLAIVTYFDKKGNVMSKGEMRGKVNVGKWEYYHENSKTISTVEHYNDSGELHGERLVYYKNGNVAELSNYANGKLEGVSKWFQDNGDIIRIINYKNNLLHGEFSSYGANRIPLIKGQYKDDAKTGVWQYFKDGELIKKTDYTKKSKNPYKKK